MIKNIVKDIDFLKKESSLAKVEDIYIVKDLLDTIKFHSNACVGMAANMIGYHKRILAFLNKDHYEVMINPVILKKEGMYKTEESCLSLSGNRECIRFKKIKVEYYNESFLKRIKTFVDFEAQIIEHEMDHFAGIII